MQLNLVEATFGPAHPDLPRGTLRIALAFDLADNAEAARLATQAAELAGKPLEDALDNWRRNDPHRANAFRLRQRRQQTAADLARAKAAADQAAGAVEAALVAGHSPESAEKAEAEATERIARLAARVDQLGRLADQEVTAAIDNLRAALQTRQAALVDTLRAAQAAARDKLTAAVAAAWPAVNVNGYAAWLAGHEQAIASRTDEAERELGTAAPRPAEDEPVPVAAD